ncbi:MAG TPA: TonB family protein [Candidatus Acidoferrales bacterium]|nr:TonB family protein [Candidatus Acidoferrales bacterium]
MRTSLMILITMALLWGCGTAPKQEATISPDFRPGGGGYSYAKIVMGVYNDAWKPAIDATSAERVTTASVVITKDGSVVSAKIVRPSGDEQMDKSVQSVLERIRTVQPFESGAKDERRTFTINFDLRAKT